MYASTCIHIHKTKQKQNNINRDKMIFVKHRYIIYEPNKDKYNKWNHEITLILIYDIHHEIDKEQIQQTRQNTQLIAVPGVWCPFINLFQFTINMSLSMRVLFYSSFVCISAYANVYSKTTIKKQNIKKILVAGVPKSQAAPAYLITAHHLCAFLMYLAR